MLDKSYFDGEENMPYNVVSKYKLKIKLFIIFSFKSDYLDYHDREIH